MPRNCDSALVQMLLQPLNGAVPEPATNGDPHRVGRAWQRRGQMAGRACTPPGCPDGSVREDGIHERTRLVRFVSAAALEVVSSADLLSTTALRISMAPSRNAAKK